MPAGTAQAILRKAIMFKLVQRLGEDICFHCRHKIESVKEFSIEHKIPWLDNNPDLFWDLDNITFSHLACNVRAARRPLKVQWPEGMAWCWRCKKFKELNAFPPTKTSKRTIGCSECTSANKALWRKKTNRH